MEQLNYSIQLDKSAINKYNFSLNNSSTYYISKKIYGKNSDMFEFDDEANNYFDFIFGYNNECLGKSIFSLSFEQINFLLANKIPLDQINLKLIFQNEENDEINDEEFEIIIIEQNEYEFKFNN